MLFVEVCIGSSCHLKGSHEIVEKLQAAIEKHKLEDKITLSGSFCMGKCNREGVSVKVGEEIFVGVKPEEFDSFFKTNILSKM